MGSGRWSATDYHERAALRARTGADAFDYSSRALRSGDLRVHQTLNPYNMRMRESRDSDEHPDSNAIFISLDVTGSMGRVVRGIHADLPRLHEMLLGHQYIPHPQILFAAVGDATCDVAPLQVGQFESDNRMDQNLENMILEGGGGAELTESYELTLYVAARHTTIDCFEKRGRKGYLFLIGDEMAYPQVKFKEVNRLIGDGLQADTPLKQIIDEVRQRYHLYFVIPGGAAHGVDKNVLEFWEAHVGPECIIRLHRPEETSECIGLTIGVNEGVISASDGVDHLRKRGVVSRTIESVARVLGAIIPGSASTPAHRTRRL
jgi:hypothetical protein